VARYKTGFALSGGFIRGFAHLGVLQALHEHNIKPDIIAGVSAGSLAGVFAADGYEPYETLLTFSHLNFLDFTRPAWSRTGGLMTLDLLIDFLREHIRAKNLEELKIPMVVTATDFSHGRSVHFTTGSIAERVAASCCLPPLFSAIEIEGVDYVDGGVFMNLPVAPLREICERVVAVNVSPLRQAEFKKNVISVAIRAFHFMSNANSVWGRHNADLLIEPDNLYEYGNTELDKAEEIFERGYEAATEILNNKNL
jgi:NTE family protein